jgi:di/tricarboxylate transporter
MPPDQIFVLCLVFATVALFIWEKVSPDLVALGALFLLLVVPFDGKPVLAAGRGDAHLAILGSIFANNAVLTVTFMFIVGAAVERTGLVDVFGHWFGRYAGRTEKRLMMVLGFLTVVTSAFLNNTTVVVVFLPMVLGFCRTANLAPSRFLIPLSYFAIAGGMVTIIGTSTNLVANGILKQKGEVPFTMFEITPLGLSMSLAMLVFLVLFGRKLLPNRPSLATLIEVDDSREFLTAAIVSDGSPLVGKTIVEAGLSKRRDLRVIEIRRSGTAVDAPIKEVRFEPGDRVILKSRVSGVMQLNDLPGLDVTTKAELGLSYVHTEKATVMEGMIGPKSSFVGQSLRELNFRQQYGLIVLAMHRQGENLRENFEKVPLEVGDTLLLEGSSERMKQLFAEQAFINLSQPKQQTVYRRGRQWVALLALVAVVVLGCLDFVAFEWVALGAALLVCLGGCLDADEIYRAVEWRIIVMILGMIGLGAAMDATGAARTIATAFMGLVGHWDPRLIISTVLLLTIVLTELLSNNAVAALLTPLAIEFAHGLHVAPQPFVIAVMLGASIGFAVPTGYQTHLLVYGAGGYRFTDFLRIGVLLDLLMWLIGSLLIPIFWPLVYR